MTQEQTRYVKVDWRIATLTVVSMVFVLVVLFRLDRKQDVVPEEPSLQSVFVEVTPTTPTPLPPVEAVPEPKEAAMTWHEGRFSSRPFYNQLGDVGMEPARIHQAIKAFTPHYDFRKSRPSHTWRVGFKGEQPVALTLHVSPVEIYDLNHLESEPVVTRREISTFTKTRVVRGQLRSSLFESLKGQQDTSQLVAKLERAFAYDIDFYTDPRKGDTFEILIEEEFILTEDGPLFHDYGDILAAHYYAGKNLIEAYRFEVAGKSSFYNEKGASLIRAFMRSPLKLQQVSSTFQRRRFHPVLKKYRPHNGVDYSAKRNTPVMAVADGKVVTAGRYGGAGIAVELQHRNQVLTQYFHLNKIAKNVRKGGKVKQGQVIGYVGKTGLATGYHLHFGMKIKGRYVDPQKQRFQPGEPIAKAHLPRFNEKVEAYLKHFQGESHELMNARKPVYPKVLKPKSI